MGLSNGGNIMEVFGFEVGDLGALNHAAIPNERDLLNPKSRRHFLDLMPYGFGVVGMALKDFYGYGNPLMIG